MIYGRPILNLEIVLHTRVFSAARVCSRSWVASLRTAANSNKHAVGQRHSNAGASTEPLCRQNMSFANDRRINHHWFAEQADNEVTQRSAQLQCFCE